VAGAAAARLRGRLHGPDGLAGPQGEAARVAAVRRFETPPAEQAQVDWEHVGHVEIDRRCASCGYFTFTVAYSRIMMAEVAPVQKLGTLLRPHEEVFRQLGGVPREILYARMKTVWQGTDERGEIVWNPVFLEFALLGLHAAAVPALSGPDEGQGGVGE
jgi:transposase